MGSPLTPALCTAVQLHWRMKSTCTDVVESYGNVLWVLGQLLSAVIVVAQLMTKAARVSQESNGLSWALALVIVLWLSS